LNLFHLLEFGPHASQRLLDFGTELFLYHLQLLPTSSRRSATSLGSKSCLVLGRLVAQAVIS
jgi:hypothetical protein